AVDLPGSAVTAGGAGFSRSRTAGGEDSALRRLSRDGAGCGAVARFRAGRSGRFTYRMPGQANSYFYGYTKLLALRKDTEEALGAKFDQKKFHDFILAQGLLPPDLM